MNGNKGNLVGFAAVVIFMVVVFIIDQGDNIGAPPKSPPSSTSSPAAAVSTGISGPWPPLNESAPNQVSDRPLATNFYVILDASGSMRDAAGGRIKIDAAKEALSVFGDSVSANANVGLLTFSPAQQRLPLAPHQPSKFKNAVSTVTAAGGTPLVASIQKGFNALTDQAVSQSGYGRYILIVVTDGRSSDGNPSRLTRDIVKSSAVEVVVIGFGLEQHALKMPGITEYHVANSIDDLINALESVVTSETESFVDPTDFKSAL